MPGRFLLLLIISLASCRYQKPGRPAPFDPDSVHRLNSLEPQEILNRLYDSPVIHGRTAIWKPNYSETMSYFRLSYDDSCHTTIDTILYFKDHDGANCAVVVFATYHYYVDSLDGMKVKIGDCHSCGATIGIALFSQNTDKRWENYAFIKALTVSGVSGGTTAGGVGQFSLVQLEDHWTGLLLKEPAFANMGEEEAGASLYSIEAEDRAGQLRTLLSYTYHSAYDEPGVAGREEDTELEVVNGKILLVTTVNGKRKVRYYGYSEEEGKYINGRH